MYSRTPYKELKLKPRWIKILILVSLFFVSTLTYFASYFAFGGNEAIPETDVIKRNENILKTLLINAHIPEYQWKNIAGGTAPIPSSLVKSLDALKQSGKF